MNRWEMEKKAAIKAIKDPQFRKKLLSKPMDAIKEIDPKMKCDRLQIRVIEEKQNEWILAIPHSAKEHEQMSEEDLLKIYAATPGKWME